MRQARRDFRHSLRLRLLIVILLIWLIPTVVLSHFISVLLPQLHRMSEDSLRSEAEYAFSQTEDSLEGLISLSRDATYDGELASAWERRQQGALGDAEFVRLSRNYLERKYSRVSLIRCAVFAPDLEGGLFLFPPADAAEAAVYREEVHGEVLALRESLDTRCGFLRASDRIWLIRGLYNTHLQPFGVLALEIDGDALFSPLSAVAEKWGAEAALRLDRVQTGSGPLEEAREGLTDPGGNTLIYSRVSASRDWDLAWRLTLPRERLYGREQQFRRLYLGLCLLLIPVLGLVALYTYRRFSRPVSLLVGAAHRIEEGELGAVVPMQGRDELGVLGRAFSAMSLRLKELVDRTYKEEIALRDARIQALQSRINPHFINNALEDINWQARMDGSEGVSRMIGALSVLLNATMAKRDRRTVPLREELSVADAYAFFIRERFGDRLTWVREVDDSLLDAALPLLTLQPVLENAVEHGIAPAGGGTIEIRIRRAEESMLIEIANTGAPLSPEDRARMDAALAGGLEGSHVGLSNIAGRLRLIYHDRAGVTASAEDGRTVVRMRIPILTGEKEENV